MAATSRWTQADGERWVAAWKLSGKSRCSFARDSGIPSHRLYYWASSVAAEVPVRSGFVELRPGLRQTSGVSVICGDNARVEVAAGFDAEVLRAVVAALGVS